jgi:hypothetical protein
MRMIGLSWSVSRGISASSVQIANFGSKRIRDAITWLAGASTSFAISVVENIITVSVRDLKMMGKNYQEFRLRYLLRLLSWGLGNHTCPSLKKDRKFFDLEEGLKACFEKLNKLIEAILVSKDPIM